jgi:hypothetical protein
MEYQFDDIQQVIDYLPNIEVGDIFYCGSDFVLTVEFRQSNRSYKATVKYEEWSCIFHRTITKVWYEDFIEKACMGALWSAGFIPSS